MKEIAKLKQLPPVYTGKWATATDSEIEQEFEKGTPFTYRFRVPKEGSLKINDLIRGEVSIVVFFVLNSQSMVRYTKGTTFHCDLGTSLSS